ncbi:MAG: hypothetical protein ACHP7N_08455 [Caulobacterales bacterium]
MLTYARWLFGSAALTNFLVGGALIFLRPWAAALLKLDPIHGTNLVLANLAGALIVVFGVGYAQAARDPAGHRDFIRLAVLGKLMAVAAIIWPWLAGDTGWILPALAGVDVIYDGLFVDYLRRTRAPG